VSTESKVQTHFHADASRFDAIYDEAKSPLTRFIDQVWRGVVRRRLDLTVAKLEPLAGRTVLDVGCGSGRYGLAFAARGAARVVGVDFAPAMIDLARQLAARAGVAERCEFRAGAFPEAVPDGPFDHSVAMGFFDYIESPGPVLAAMREKTRDLSVMSFPKAIEWRVPIRRARFLMLGCPLFLYTAGRTRQLLAAAGFTDYEWIPLDRDYIVVARGSARD
jgi:2-polyprenyl-3-methyl-5-hydroxy-6-metoxy-1,4-benzoquinol methylase